MSHQKRVKTDWIRLHSKTGSLKHDMAYVGIDARIVFSNTILAAPDKYLLVQLWVWCLIRSTIDANMYFFIRPMCSCKLRHFPIPHSLLIFSSLFTRILHYLLILEEKVIADLDRFIHCAEAILYFVKMESKVANLAAFYFPKNIVLLAYKRWFMGR